jgi:hypothetical protein
LSKRFLTSTLVLGLLAGGLGATLNALPAAAAAADGSGTMAVSPTSVLVSSTTNTLTFTYTAAAGGLSSGEIEVVVPSDWSPPQTTSGTAGYTTLGTCSGGALSIMSTYTIEVTGVTLASGATCTVSYGTSGGASGARAPSTSETSTFNTSEESTAGGTLTALPLASLPTVRVGPAPDGSGTMTVSPNSAQASSTTNTLTFTYTAAAGGLTAGRIDVVVPSDWSPPQTTSGTAGYTTLGTCGGGTLSIAPTFTIEVTGVTLASGVTCTITYGTGGGTSGAKAPSTPETSTFNTSEESTASGTLTALASSPTVTVSSGLVITLAATSAGGTTATLNGSINDEGVATNYFFAYGTASNLAGATDTTEGAVGASSSVQDVSANITGLSSATTYYFQLMTTTDGDGAILSFTTATTGVTQIYGIDPIGTSVATSEAEFPTAGSAGAVVLARDDFFSDALAGGPLAASVNGPLLLTEGAPVSATLDPRTQAEIQRVLPTGGTVYILGGDLALSPTIDTTLTGLGYNVVREAGSDEYATAVDVAEQLGNPTTIFEATGLSFYDALSAVPAAIKDHAAILLTDGSSQAFETYEYLLAHPGDTRYAIGGQLAAYGADPTATPVYGQDLFGTSAAVATTFFPDASIFGVATSADFPDALGGGVFMATGGRSGPLLLVNPTTPLPPEILPYLASRAPGSPGFVFGGPLAVGSAVVAAVEAAVG